MANNTSYNGTVAPVDIPPYSDLFDYYEQTDCLLSNDPPFGGQGTAYLKICNVTQYMCAAVASANTANGTELQVDAVVVPFEYELHYNPEADLEKQVLPYLEESMLEHVAETVGVSLCIRQRKRRRQTAQLKSRFVGANLEPRDSLNKKYTTCMASNGAVENGDDCVPIQGAMTVFVQRTAEEQASQLVYTEDDRQAIRNTISNILKDATDSNLFVVPTSIDRVVFVGNSIPSATASASVTHHNGALSKLHIGLISGAASFMLLLLLLLLICCCCCCRKRNRRANGRNQAVDSAVERAVASTPETVDRAVDEDDVEGGERCLASLDSLALQTGGSMVKPSCYDDVSTSSSRTASVEESATIPKSDDEDTGNVPSDEIEDDEYANDDDMLTDSFQQDEFALLDRLALRPPLVPRSDSSSVRSQEHLGLTRSLSPAMTDGSQVTMPAGNLHSQTNVSETTLLAGNHGPRHHSRPPSTVSSHSPRVTGLALSPAVTRLALAPDSFDDEIMCMISSDEDMRHPDVLHGHGAYYVSDDSDADRLSLRSDTVENAKRHLQMS